MRLENSRPHVAHRQLKSRHETTSSNFLAARCRQAPTVYSSRGFLDTAEWLSTFHHRASLQISHFFILPVLLMTWYVGANAGYGVGYLAVLLWFVADRVLGGDQAGFFRLMFNTAMRLLLTLGGIWLLEKLRRVLERERRLACEDGLTGMANRREFF